MMKSKKSKRIVDGNHYDHYEVAVKLARDEDPVQQAFVHRRCTVDQQQWETYLGIEGIASGPGSGSDYNLGSGSASSGAAPVHHKGGLMRKNTSTYDMEASGRDPRQMRRRSPRSIFGLPIMSPLTPFVKVWSTMILALDLIYTAFLIPMLVSFEVPDIGWTWGAIVNLVAGTIYFMELLMNFHIGFIGKWGTQKKIFIDGKAVAWYYMVHGQFFVDTLTAVAWIAQIVLIIMSDRGVDITGPVSTIYQIIRILRLIRFISLMNRLYATAIAAGGAIFPVLNLKPQYAYFVNLIYGGMAVLSFLSCLMNFVARREGCGSNTWIARVGILVRTYGGPESQTAGVLTQDECQAVPDPAKWLTGAYFMLVTMLSIGYGDITPASIVEMVVCMFCMIAGIVFFGILLGSIAEALNDLNKESKRIAKYRARMESVDKWMGKRGLSKSLRMRIGQHYQEEWIADTEALEEVQIMEEVPHAIRREIAWACNKKIFLRVGLFHNFPMAEQQTIAAMMTPLQLPAGADVCEAGDVADCIWLLHEGTVAAVDASGDETCVTCAPALLGETALLRELGDEFHFRPCAIRTRQMCLLWVIPMRDLLPLLRRHPTLYHRAVQQAVPSMAFDYLQINPIGNHVGGGVASGEGHRPLKNGASDNGAAQSGDSLVSSRKQGLSGNSFHGVVQAATQAAASDTRAQQRPLHSAKNGPLSPKKPLESKPSWTTLQASYGKSRSVDAKQFKALMNLS